MESEFIEMSKNSKADTYIELPLYVLKEQYGYEKSGAGREFVDRILAQQAGIPHPQDMPSVTSKTTSHG